jgi:LmbE family N-acetylglucosaminyl deacetylase
MPGRSSFTLATALFLALPWTAGAQILVVAPHPDDDIITSAGVVYRAHQRSDLVKVVFVTNGDANGPKLADVRQAEAVAGQRSLGTSEEDLIFLGYPDGSLDAIRRNYAAEGSSFTSPHGVSATYATRGLGRADYHRHRVGSSGPYNWPTMVSDLMDVLVASRPAHIFTTSEWDTHSDHSTTYFLVVEAIRRAATSVAGYAPTIHKTVVWPGDESWPAPADPTAYFTEMPRTRLANPAALPWKERESLDVPPIMQTEAANPKYLAVAAHDSQGGVNRYIGRWIHKDEFFWTEQVIGRNRPPVPNAGLDQAVGEGVVVTLDGGASWDRNDDPLVYTWRQITGPRVTLSNPHAVRPTFETPTALAENTVLGFELVVSDATLSSVPDGVKVSVRGSAPPKPTYGRNLAPLATITASTERGGSGQAAGKVADGVVDGYPIDGSREWVTNAEGAGAWIAMAWPQPVTVGTVILHDRPNNDDQLILGTIEFSDGSKVTVGPLANSGSGVEYAFPPRKVNSLRLNIAQVSRATVNIGLAEFQVFEVGGPAATPTAPVATAPTPIPPPAPQRPTLDMPAPKPAEKSTSPTPAATPATRGPAGVNIANSAKVTSSSERAPAQAARSAIDGVAAGYPAEPGREWATVAETAGAWIELRWATPHVVSGVRLHDRPNPDDQIVRATLTFSDGSSVPVGALENDGSATDIEFDPRRVTWLRLSIDACSSSTVNVGLAEFFVFASARN